MKNLKVVMVGQPNVGKSSIINAISGARLRVGNFAGVTVEKKEVFFRRDDTSIHMIDLPGIYSLSAYTPEEHVAKSYLLNENYDIIVNVVDANALLRNLILTLQLLDMNKKMVLVVNMVDEIEKSGGSIDALKLSMLLGIPVILASARENRGIEEIAAQLARLQEAPLPKNKIFFDERIEAEIKTIQKILERSRRFDSERSRFIAIRLLKKDEDVYKIVHDDPIFIELHEELGAVYKRLAQEFDQESTADIISNERVGMVRSIIIQVFRAPRKESLTDKIDKILIHPFAGLPIFLFFMWGLFQLTFTIGSIPMDYIDAGFAWFSQMLKGVLTPGVLSDVLTDGVIPAVGSIIMFLPNILILFLGINLLEQTGYMARAAFLLDGFLKHFGLQGKAFIPLVSGFGCSVPAYMAARTLKNPKDRIITMLIIGFMNCSARLPVYVLLIAAFFPASNAGNILFAIYIGGALLGLVVAKILRSVLFRGEPEPFVMEMPLYRFPSFKALGVDLWIKAKMFINKAGTFIAIAAMLVWFLSAYPTHPEIVADYEAKQAQAATLEQKKQLQNEQSSILLEKSYLGMFGKTIEPVFEPLGFDWRLSVATLSGWAAKEVVVSTLATLYAVGEANESSGSFLQKLRDNIDFKAAVALIIIIMIYSPCVAAMSTFWAEVPQWAWRAFYLVYPNVLAWLLAYAAYNILAVLGY